MCVSASSAMMSRAGFAALLGAAAAPLLGTPVVAQEQVAALASITTALPHAPGGLSAANTRAARIAATSPFVQAAFGAAQALAQSISLSALRTSVLELFADPSPRYIKAAPTPQARERIRRTLLDEKLIADDVPLGAIYPHLEGPAQPFWSTPGSGTGSHHAYPGGLLVHELFNARMAAAFSHEYRTIYFNAASTATVDRDTVIAAAFYHDIMKAVVFAWTDDGVPAKEYRIGGTTFLSGAHHVLSGAEAIARGMSPTFVTVLLSAHAAPSLGDETHVIDWCRAASIIAGVDPIEFGLVRKTVDGYALAATYIPIEAFISHLSDHDYVISVPAMREASAQLATLAAKFGVDPAKPGDLAWWRNAVLSRTTAINLHQVLATRGEAAFIDVVTRTAKSINAF